MTTDSPPDVVVLLGPPAVGKMTVGRALGERTGYRLLHNHMTIEPVLDVFGWGTPSFHRLVDGFRRQILAEAVRAPDVPGLVFTLVWAFDEPEDLRLVGEYVDLVEAAGGAVGFAELVAPLAVRLERNATPERLGAKPSKRDLAFSDANVRDLERHVMDSADPRGVGDDVLALLGRHPHVRVDNTDLTPSAAAERVAVGLGLPDVGARPDPDAVRR